MRFLTTLLILSLVTATLSCNRVSNQGGTPSAAKRYHLKGRVVSIDKRANMANIDGEEIPGFMRAMTMPYVVKPAAELDRLSAGELITADVVVRGDDSWIENITVTGHASAPSAK